MDLYEAYQFTFYGENVLINQSEMDEISNYIHESMRVRSRCGTGAHADGCVCPEIFIQSALEKVLPKYKSRAIFKASEEYDDIDGALSQLAWDLVKSDKYKLK